MALRLSEYVEGGDIFNSTPNSVHGCIKLFGHEQPLHLDLTGSFDPDLAGKHIYFEPRHEKPKMMDKKLFKSLAIHQIGPTGVMTAARRVRVPTCSTEELLTVHDYGDAADYNILNVVGV